MDYRVTANQVAQLHKFLAESHGCEIDGDSPNHSIITDGDVTLDCTFTPADHGPGLLDVGIAHHPFWKTSSIIFGVIGPKITGMPDEPVVEAQPEKLPPPPPDPTPEELDARVPGDKPSPHPQNPETVN